MNNIFSPNDKFDFTQISLAHPNGLQGGSYFTKISNKDDPLYIQTPKCSTRQGIITSGKKIYCDLMFSNENESFIQWMENLESEIQHRIYAKRNVWFHSDLELCDIESAFTSPMRIYKSGKYYLVRVYIQHYQQNIKPTPSCRIYDENENILQIEDIKTDSRIIGLLEFQGIKFSSRSFQFEIALKQIMVLQDYNMTNTCYIKHYSIDSKNSENINDTQMTISNPQSKHMLQIEDKSCNQDQVNSEKAMINKENITVIDEQDNVEEKNVEEGNVEEKNIDEEDNVDKEHISLEISKKTVGQHEDSLEQLNDNEELKDKYLEKNIEKTKQNDGLVEIALEVDDKEEVMSLKTPKDVYIDIYREAIKKAKASKQAAIEAYLEAKNIKTTYLSDMISNEEEEEIEDLFGEKSEAVSLG